MKKKIVVNYLMKLKAKLNTEIKFNENSWYKEMPLFIPCENSNEEIVKYLVECGIEINIRDK
ncbi:hypothetical protein BCR32DRAFT_281504 [Anaeromyces robustus]|uniref:Uncharacterized protein n=1 Tax=Anaeromyces robustus TaxID=1754192 RepID=A0A1Y1X0V6_9FUNG|nr:hypothetical protein BCR32DRAFT_281504 [Anaeromyces robustus]|eukprot:ORX79332.1 hypothetical protein BCR32DRAFT_281504 [Anaeromyces robustus]